MTWLFVVSYILAPLVLLAASAGAGLLARRLAGGRVAPVLVLPLGFATLLAVGTFLTAFSFTARLNAVAIVVLGVGGLVLERRTIRELLGAPRSWAWPAAAGFGGYLAVIAPALLSGEATWTGYARIVDLAMQMEWAQWLTTHGREIPPIRDSSFHEVISKTAVTGYPGAGNAVFGSVGQLLGTQPIWIYQPFMAITAGMLALSVYGLLERAVPQRPLRALAGFVAAQPNILYGYALVGGIKELTSAVALVFCGAVAGTMRPREGIRAAVPLAIGVSAGIGTFSLTIGPWFGVVLAGAVLATTLVRRPAVRVPGVDVRALRTWAGTAVIVLVLSAPMLYWATQLAKVAVQAEGANATALIDLGNLAAPIAVRASIGVWISGDYRVPHLGDTPETLLVGLTALALAAVGLAFAARRRDRGLLLLTAATGVALLYFTQRTGPWIELKAICLAGPVVLALAFAGASALLTSVRLRAASAVVGVVATVAVTAGVLLGNAEAYHDITLAPAARMYDLQRVGERFAGEGPALYPAHEEYAEFFLRDVPADVYVNPGAEGTGIPAPRGDVLARAPQPSFAYDLDALATAMVERYPLVILRRGPLWSRPPADYELAQRTRFVEVWRRTGPAGQVLQHVPVPGAGPTAVAKECRQLTARARREGDRVRVAYATAGESVVARLGRAKTNPAWITDGKDTVVMNGPGWAQLTVDVPTTATYRVWVQGPDQRPVDVSIDGRRAGTLKDTWSYPQGWTDIGTMRVAAGRRKVRLDRGGGRPLPGDGAGGFPIGPVVLERVDPSPARGSVRIVPASQASEVCADAERYDWVELLKAP
jgi:hypothetical protein